MARLSSEAHGGAAWKANDGDVDPYHTHGSVAHSGSEVGLDGAPPHWSIRFPAGAVAGVGTIKLWNREQLPGFPEIQSITVEDFETIPSGTYSLSLDHGRAGLAAVR